MPNKEIDTKLLAYIKSQQSCVAHNSDIISILEGDLLSFIERHLASEFSQQAFESVKTRISPINFLKRIIDKLSKIYQQPVQRIVINGTESDQELIDAYIESMEMDSSMNVGNELFNTFKNNLNQIYYNEAGFPKLRVIQNDSFYIYSTDLVEPTNPTHVILPYGQKEVFQKVGKEEVSYNVDLFKVYTKDEAYLLDVTGETSPINSENPDMVNPFGVLPFMYANRSRTRLVPIIDSDTKRLSILLPVLISDLNYAVKYQVASIIWTIDVDAAALQMNPNSIWALKSDPTSDKRPEVGQIKPQVDIEQVIQLIITQLSMWLNSKNIRPGSVSDMSATDAASGISKLVDEMDTSDERKKQVEVYRQVEKNFWKDLINNIHPTMLAQGLLADEFRRPFTKGAYVDVNFPEQLPMIRRGQAVTDLKTEHEAGFISRETAMKKLNPEWSEVRLQEEISMIEEGRTIVQEPEDSEKLNEDQEEESSEEENLENGSATTN
jgi:hypothetical protein